MSNLAAYMLDDTLVRDGAGEVPNADWSGGCNLAGSNAPSSANTGGGETKADNFSRVADTAAHKSQHIGVAGGAALRVVQGADVNDTLAFVEAEQDTADGVELDATTGAVNRTGKEVPIGDWVWGVIPVA